MKKKFLLLRCEMLKHDIDAQTLAAMVGISANSLSNRLRGVYPFSAAEMSSIAAILSIPPERYYQYFIEDYTGGAEGGERHDR